MDLLLILSFSLTLPISNLEMQKHDSVDYHLFIGKINRGACGISHFRCACWNLDKILVFENMLASFNLII